MEQQIKRFKPTKESIIADIASSIDQIAKSIKSMGDSYSEILRVNKMIVMYLRNAEECAKEKNLNQAVADLEHTFIRD